MGSFSDLGVRAQVLERQPAGRNRAREYAYFAAIARGSVREVETQLLLGLRLGLIRRGDIVEPPEFGDQINRMLTALIKRLR